MEEKIFKGKKNGMLVLLLTILLYAAAIGGVILCAIALETGVSVLEIIGLIICVAYLCLGWIFWLGLKIIKPQEALVLTLFGKYIGTLKEEGFYWVNPFCTGVNPAYKTKLNQSGDVKNAYMATTTAANVQVALTPEDLSKKISLKLMTLSNSRQKINDCLGNPIEIAIATPAMSPKPTVPESAVARAPKEETSPLCPSESFFLKICKMPCLKPQIAGTLK